MATDRERKILVSEILALVGRDAAKLPEQEITGFLSMKGDLYSGELMVVGRAVNGWIKGIRTQDLADSKESERFAGEVLADTNSRGNCPMGWVTGCWEDTRGEYNTKRSAFWRVIREVVGRLGIANIDDGPWSSHLVWSNLYKVSPAKAGNPSGRLCNAQLEGCISLLDAEIAEYCPKRLLFLTGIDWAKPFLSRIMPAFEKVSNSYVKAVGSRMIDSGGTMKVVVAVHPQGKAEAPWVSEVVEAFGR